MGSTPVGDWRMLSQFDEGLKVGIQVAGATPLVLDRETSELVHTPAKFVGKRVQIAGNSVLDMKTAVALKSHSEAERRRRERINSHLTTLRSLVPATEKLDKAALLAEVIRHVKKLKCHAAEISKGYTIPSDVDEVNIEFLGDTLFKATLCSEDHPDLLAELNRTILSMNLKIVKAEIATLSGRVKNIILMTSEGNVNRHMLTASIHEALKSVLDRITPPADFLPRAGYSNKRRRISLFESSSSSC